MGAVVGRVRGLGGKVLLLKQVLVVSAFVAIFFNFEGVVGSESDTTFSGCETFCQGFDWRANKGFLLGPCPGQSCRRVAISYLDADLSANATVEAEWTYRTTDDVAVVRVWNDGKEDGALWINGEVKANAKHEGLCKKVGSGGGATLHICFAFQVSNIGASSVDGGKGVVSIKKVEKDGSHSIQDKAFSPSFNKACPNFAWAFWIGFAILLVTLAFLLRRLYLRCCTKRLTPETYGINPNEKLVYNPAATTWK